MIQKIIQFLQIDLWRIRSRHLPKSKFYLIRFLRTVALALRGFNEDQCYLRASALTYYSLLSIVPVIAMAFGIAKGFGLQNRLEEELVAKMQGQEEMLMKLIDFAKNLLENTKGGVVAGIGVALLFWAVIKVLGHVESAFNHIWGVKTGRSMGRKFSDYLSLMLICPVLFIFSSSATVFISTQVHMITQKVALLGMFSGLVESMLKTLPYLVIWLLFSFVYVFLPNTKIKITAGILGGIVAGTIYQVVQWLYIFFQVGVSKYNAIYGSFAALPLFFVWLQLSWLVVLLGAEIAFAFQNESTYEYEPDCLKASIYFKRRVALWLTQFCVKRFCDGKKPLTADQLAHELEVPIRLIRLVLFDLVEAGILSEVKVGEGKDPAYQPGQDANKLTIKRVLDMLNASGTENIPIPDRKDYQTLVKRMDGISKAMENSPDNIPLYQAS